MKNYTFIKEKYIEEIESTVSLYKHNKSGARICTIKNSDENKVFSIAFRTPPINNCGLTHILEHSVLCGSKKYPVKDPFVELIKTSLNTFINAFTFPDKTMYPIASLNQEDFKNLMAVYMDAVFYPNIYSKEEIFRQEGWRYDILDKNDDITYNGVVYNEMKGAFSDPNQIHARMIMHSLYPDTAYGLESGGDPKYIPDLDYKVFLKFHSEYYSPSNSYIYLYGDCDMDERMEWLDKEYLSKFDIVDFDTTLKPQKPFDKPRYESDTYQTSGELNNKTFLSYNFVLPSSFEMKDLIASDVLVEALFNIPGAPIKERIQKEGIGDDVSAYLEKDVLQPMIEIQVTGANSDDEEKFISIIDEEFKKCINGGLDKKSLLSLINSTEFSNREKDFSSRMPKGLMLEISGLASWLYDEDGPYKMFELIHYYPEIKEELKTNYFEKLIDKGFLNNNHKTYVKLVPTLDSSKEYDEELKKKLKAYKESLSEKELEELIEKNKKLKEYQSSPSTKEELDTLPKLKIEDIDREPEKYNLDVLNDKYQILYSNYKTNGISYINYHFELSHIDPNDLIYLALYTDLFKSISTKSHSYYELNQIITGEYGTINSSVSVLETKELTNKLYLVYSISALNEKISDANDLLLEIINDTNYSDYDRIYQKLAELKSDLEFGIQRRGHVTALNRASSSISEMGLYKDTMSGIRYLDFIKDLYNNFDSKKEELSKKLYDIKNYMAKSNFVVNIVGDEDSFKASKVATDKLYNSLKETMTYNTFEFKENPLKEAIIAPINVNYVARCGKYSMKHNFSSLVLAISLSLDYLWVNVRVKGGAYGCMLDVKENQINFTSYRDPNVDYTNDAYTNIVDYIKNFNPSDEELLGYKIGAISNSQSVVHNKVKGLTACQLYLQGLDYEYRKNNRAELLDATKEQLVEQAKWYEEALNNSAICVIGTKDKIESSNIKFDKVREL